MEKLCVNWHQIVKNFSNFINNFYFVLYPNKNLNGEGGCHGVTSAYQRLQFYVGVIPCSPPVVVYKRRVAGSRSLLAIPPLIMVGPMLSSLYH